MITVPQEVVDAYRNTSVEKNIRLHFLDGDRVGVNGDITKTNMILESVVLNESICSENNLKIWIDGIKFLSVKYLIFLKI